MLSRPSAQLTHLPPQQACQPPCPAFLAVTVPLQVRGAAYTALAAFPPALVDSLELELPLADYTAPLAEEPEPPGVPPPAAGLTAGAVLACMGFHAPQGLHSVHRGGNCWACLLPWGVCPVALHRWLGETAPAALHAHARCFAATRPAGLSLHQKLDAGVAWLRAGAWPGGGGPPGKAAAAAADDPARAGAEALARVALDHEHANRRRFLAAAGSHSAPAGGASAAGSRDLAALMHRLAVVVPAALMAGGGGGGGRGARGSEAAAAAAAPVAGHGAHVGALLLCWKPPEGVAPGGGRQAREQGSGTVAAAEGAAAAYAAMFHDVSQRVRWGDWTHPELALTAWAAFMGRWVWPFDPRHGGDAGLRWVHAAAWAACPGDRRVQATTACCACCRPTRVWW